MYKAMIRCKDPCTGFASLEAAKQSLYLSGEWSAACREFCRSRALTHRYGSSGLSEREAPAEGRTQVKPDRHMAVAQMYQN